MNKVVEVVVQDQTQQNSNDSFRYEQQLVWDAIERYKLEKCINLI
jgi:hypothetical protein